jgi:hypothetical protein
VIASSFVERVIGIANFPGQVVLLAYLDRCELDDATILSRIQAELRGLGAVLIVISRDGTFRVRPDDAVERCESFAGRGEHSPALVVLDASGRVRFEHVFSSPADVSIEALADALESAGRAFHASPRRGIVSRRELIVTSVLAAFTLAFLDGCKSRPSESGTTTTTGGGIGGDIELTLDVNGKPAKLNVDVRTTLLDALRDRLGITGTK